MRHNVRFREILGDSTLTLPPEVFETASAAEDREPSLECLFTVKRGGQRHRYRLAVWSFV